MDPQKYFERAHREFYSSKSFDVVLDAKIVSAWVLAMLRYDREAVERHLLERCPELAQQEELRRLLVGSLMLASRFFTPEGPAWEESLQAVVDLEFPDRPWSFAHPWIPRV